MATDYIIGALIVVSTAVNALALGAFWISPGLRTTANRFVINLLIANLAGCLVLCPVMIDFNPSSTFTGGVAAATTSVFSRVNDNNAYYDGSGGGDDDDVEATTSIIITTTVKISAAEVSSSSNTSLDQLLLLNVIDCANESIKYDKWNCSSEQLFNDDPSTPPLLLQQALYGANVNLWNFDLTTALGKVFFCAYKYFCDILLFTRFLFTYKHLNIYTLIWNMIINCVWLNKF